MRTAACRKAGNYNAVAVGLGADDYQLWHRLYKSAATFVRDDEVRNVVYRIHEKNSLKIRKARYGAHQTSKNKLAATAAAASIAFWVGAHADPAMAAPVKSPQAQVKQQDEKKSSKPAKGKTKKEKLNLVPPQS